MMRVLTEDAGLYCKHGPGKVSIAATQQLVSVEGRRLLVEPDPVGRRITGCPSVVPFKPCLTTLAVQKGYSQFIRIENRRLCLDTITGFTDGTPPGVVMYVVRLAGQEFVSEMP
jgi:hypothetical protein